MRTVFLDVMLFFVCLISGLLLASAVSYTILFAFNSVDLLTKISNQSELSLSEINLLKINQLVYTIIVFGGASLLFSFYKTKHPLKFFLEKINPLSLDFLHLIPLLILFYPLVVISYEINNAIVFPENLKHIESLLHDKEQQAKWLTDILLKADSTAILLINLLMVGVLPAIFEEYIFRGCLQKSLYQSTQNIFLSITISAFLFSAIHFQFYGFLPRFLLGALLGWVYFVTGNIAYPVILHLINNASQVLLVFFVDKYHLPWNVLEPEPVKFLPAMASTLLFVILALQFQSKYRLKNE